VEPEVTSQVETTRAFVGPWWLAIALLEVQSRQVIEPVLREPPARLAPESNAARLARVDLGPVVRAGTEGRLALSRALPGAATFPTMTGELRIVEIDGNRSELTLTGEFAASAGLEGPRGTDAVRLRFDQVMLDDMTERLARAIEAAVAREIGTAPSGCEHEVRLLTAASFHPGDQCLRQVGTCDPGDEAVRSLRSN